MLWQNSMDNLPMYIHCNIPIEPLLTASLLGLQLAEDLELGSRYSGSAVLFAVTNTISVLLVVEK